MIPDMTQLPERKTEVDDKDYMDLFLNDGYDPEAAENDSRAGMDGWWSNHWVPQEWMGES